MFTMTETAHKVVYQIGMYNNFLGMELVARNVSIAFAIGLAEALEKESQVMSVKAIVYGEHECSLPITLRHVLHGVVRVQHYE